MGLYTDHWARHKARERKGTLMALAVVVVGLPGIAGFGAVLEPLGTLDVVVVLIAVSGWIAALVGTVMHYSRVHCPKCAGWYSRGKYLSNCPHCGLRMLQEDG
jgi:hypothetical protein